MGEDFDDLYTALAAEEVENEALSDEADWQADLGGGFEGFDCDYLFGEVVPGAEDLAVAALCYFFEDGVFFSELLRWLLHLYGVSWYEI